MCGTRAQTTSRRGKVCGGAPDRPPGRMRACTARASGAPSPTAPSKAPGGGGGHRPHATRRSCTASCSAMWAAPSTCRGTWRCSWELVRRRRRGRYTAERPVRFAATAARSTLAKRECDCPQRRAEPTRLKSLCQAAPRRRARSGPGWRLETQGTTTMRRAQRRHKSTKGHAKSGSPRPKSSGARPPGSPRRRPRAWQPSPPELPGTGPPGTPSWSQSARQTTDHTARRVSLCTHSRTCLCLHVCGRRSMPM